MFAKKRVLCLDKTPNLAYLQDFSPHEDYDKAILAKQMEIMKSQVAMSASVLNYLKERSIVDTVA
jgi:hypothetical protein